VRDQNAKKSSGKYDADVVSYAVTKVYTLAQRLDRLDAPILGSYLGMTYEGIVVSKIYGIQAWGNHPNFSYNHMNPLS